MAAVDLVGRLGIGSRVRDEKPARGVGARSAHAWLGLLPVVAGCTTLPPPRDPLSEQIATYYAGHATEEDGRCSAPAIASVTKRKVLASGGDSTRVRVRYSYVDEGAEASTGWTSVFRADQVCTGVAERDFTLVRDQLGYKVIEMSGPVRDE